MPNNYEILKQHVPLPLYGAADVFLDEVRWYSHEIAHSSSVHEKDMHYLLSGFSSLRALKAALIAVREHSASADLLLAEGLTEPEKQISLRLAMQAEVKHAWQEKEGYPADEVTFPHEGAFAAGGLSFCDIAAGPVRIIGELVNPNFRMQAKKIILERQDEALGDMLLEQRGNGASLLCLGSEAKGLDAKEAWEWLSAHHARLVDLPLYLEIERVSHLEWVLPQLPGKPLVLCRQADRAERARLLQLCHQHIAMVVLGAAQLENRSKEARLYAARELVAEAKAAGLAERDLVLEVTTLASPGAPLLFEETLEAISLLKKEFGLPLLVPVSQVSRSRLVHGWSNAFYAACAMDRGADLLLANPSQREVMAIVQAANELRC